MLATGSRRVLALGGVRVSTRTLGHLGAALCAFVCGFPAGIPHGSCGGCPERSKRDASFELLDPLLVVGEREPLRLLRVLRRAYACISVSCCSERNTCG